jgi:hypothetical protein
MKEPHVEGSSDPPRPRVMAVRPQARLGPMGGRSVGVDSPSTLLRAFPGRRRLGIELRNHFFGVPTSFPGREGNTMCGDSASRVIGPAESKTLCMRGSSMHENREIPAAPAVRLRPGTAGVPWPDGRPVAGRSEKACGCKSDTYAAGKSDTSVVPVNAGNKAGTRDMIGHGGTVLPPRNRKSGAGNPPPAAGRVAWSVGLRTGGREGW